MQRIYKWRAGQKTNPTSKVTIKTVTGWLYLTTIIDLYDRQVIGWSLSTR